MDMLGRIGPAGHGDGAPLRDNILKRTAAGIARLSGCAYDERAEQNDGGAGPVSNQASLFTAGLPAASGHQAVWRAAAGKLARHAYSVRIELQTRRWRFAPRPVPAVRTLRPAPETWRRSARSAIAAKSRT